MAGISIKHSFVSLKGDGTDATQIQPSAWNSAHSFTLDSGYLVGRLSAGNGNAEQIAISAYMASLLGAADAATLAGLLGLFATGDVKYTFQNAASSGWLLIGASNNTIGNASSGALLRANADTWNLFNLLYSNVTDSYAPVSSGRSGNALTDFNANKTITIPNLVGRVPVGAGGSTAWAAAKVLGVPGGEETHTLSTTEIPSHYHVAGINDPTHAHVYSAYDQTYVGSGGLGGGGGYGHNFGNATSAAATGVRVTSSNGLDTTYSAGGGGAHNNLQPFIGLIPMVKL